MIGIAVPVLAAPFVACSYMALRAQSRQSPALEGWNLAAALPCTALVPVFALAGDWPGVIPVGALAALRWWLWLRGPRRRRKRSLRALGNKALRALAVMLRNMPKPAPRVFPQGARA
jgi:hypothetical protein